MDKSLLNRFFKCEVSEEESKEVMAWLNSDDFDRELDSEAREYFDEDHEKKIIWNSKDVYNSIKLSFKKNLTHSTTTNDENDNAHSSSLYDANRKNRMHSFWKVAAVIFIILIPAVAFFSYFISGDSALNEHGISMVSKHADKGQKLSVYLSDGSKVILNSQSEISYPKEFGAENRKINLTGEAYFEITKDASRPFIVRTGAYETVVLGTSFNISAFPNNHIEVALRSGEVLVKPKIQNPKNAGNIYLVPGEVVSINTTDHISEITSFSDEQIFDWTVNTLSFDSEPLEIVFARLEAWYAVDFSFNEHYYNKKGTLYSGRFENESLENVLIGLGYVNDFDFKIIDKTIEIKFKKP